MPRAEWLPYLRPERPLPLGQWGHAVAPLGRRRRVPYPQVGIAGGIDELQVEPVAAMLGELGREVRGDQHPFPAVRLESILDGGQRDRPVDGLDLGEELEAFPAFCDLDHRVRAVALQGLGCPGGERRSQARRLAQRVEGMVQDLDFTAFLLPHRNHHQPSWCSATADVHVT